VRLNCKKSAEVIVLTVKNEHEIRSKGWRLFATKPKGGHIWKQAALNDLLKALGTGRKD
jgi:hypothetical protein